MHPYKEIYMMDCSPYLRESEIFKQEPNPIFFPKRKKFKKANKR